MGKGDKKSRKGKIIMGSYGVRRKRSPIKMVSSLEVVKEKKIKKVTSPSLEVKAAVKKKKTAEPKAE